MPPDPNFVSYVLPVTMDSFPCKFWYMEWYIDTCLASLGCSYYSMAEQGKHIFSSSPICQDYDLTCDRPEK
jgi:hypothetical protein